MKSRKVHMGAIREFRNKKLKEELFKFLIQNAKAEKIAKGDKLL